MRPVACVTCFRNTSPKRTFLQSQEILRENLDFRVLVKTEELAARSPRSPMVTTGRRHGGVPWGRAGQGPSVRPEAGLGAVPLRGQPLPAWPRGVSSARPPQALRGRPVLSPYEAPSLSRTYCTHSCPLSMAGRPPRLTPLPPGEWLTCSAILSSVPPPPPLQTPQARAHRCRITDAPTEPELEPKKPPAARQASRLACALPRRFFSLLRARGDCGRGRRHGTPAQRTSIRSLSARDERQREGGGR